jgi:hypothetical protein
MYWKFKALAFLVLDILPAGDSAHRWVQRRLTGTAHRDMSGENNRYQTVFLRHLNEFKKCGKPIEDISYLEFGAGYDLAANIYYYCMGIERQALVDIVPIMQPTQVERMVHWYQANPPPGAVRTPLSDLAKMGIEYKAPMRLQDIRGRFDVISTIDTMEHIPAPEVPEIARCCKALLNDDGVCVMSIDYTDHYSHADSAITPYNFLRYSPAGWRVYNSSRHYQSRSRHTTYREAFASASLTVDEIYIELPDGWETRLARVPLHSDFRGMPPREVAIQRATLSIRQVR